MSTMLSLSASYYSSSRLLCPFSSSRNPLLFFTRCRRRRIALSCTRRHLAVAASERENGVFTSPEVAKSFDFAAEERIYNWWESQGYFRPSFDRGSDPFVIPMPPPNVTGSLHMGHAMFVTLEDIMIRYNRMKGRPTLWLPGTDHAGIATQLKILVFHSVLFSFSQLVVERMLASEGVKRTELSRDEFTKRVWQWKEKKYFQKKLVSLGGAPSEMSLLLAFTIGRMKDYFVSMRSERTQETSSDNNGGSKGSGGKKDSQYGGSMVPHYSKMEFPTYDDTGDSLGCLKHCE
ncbi:hypothetical protein JHK84_047958 [Glycine max]|nr:hypothetical protein JHK84_047958 [Glycine max]